MNPLLLVRAQCLDVVTDRIFQSIGDLQNNIAPILRAAREEGLIDAWDFSVRDSRLHIHLARSPVSLPTNHHSFYVVWPSVIADMKDAIDGV